MYRYSSKPKEVVLECAEFEESELRLYLDDILLTAVEFLEDHRYDPSEIYEEEFVDDIKDIPSPKRDPNSIIEDFQNILHTMGKSSFSHNSKYLISIFSKDIKNNMYILSTIMLLVTQPLDDNLLISRLA